MNLLSKFKYSILLCAAIATFLGIYFGYTSQVEVTDDTSHYYYRNMYL